LISLQVLLEGSDEMPWSSDQYPDSMKNLDRRIRNKAIEIANSLLEEGYEEGRAISIATAQAKRWADGSADSDHRQDITVHVMPHENGWAIKKENAKQASFTFETKEKAMNKAREMAADQSMEIVIHKKDGSIQDRLSSGSDQ
jgi:uncharacterized protein YdaT